MENRKRLGRPRNSLLQLEIREADHRLAPSHTVAGRGSGSAGIRFGFHGRGCPRLVGSNAVGAGIGQADMAKTFEQNIMSRSPFIN